MQPPILWATQRPVIFKITGHPAVKIGATLAGLYACAVAVRIGVSLYLRPRAHYEVLTQAEELLRTEHRFKGLKPSLTVMIACLDVMDRCSSLGLAERCPEAMDRLVGLLAFHVNACLELDLSKHTTTQESSARLAVLVMAVACSLMTPSEIDAALGGDPVSAHIQKVARLCVGVWRRSDLTLINACGFRQTAQQAQASSLGSSGKGAGLGAWAGGYLRRAPVVLRAWRAVLALCNWRWLGIWIGIAFLTAAQGTIGRLRQGSILPDLAHSATNAVESIRQGVSRQLGVPASRVPDVEYLLPAIRRSYEPASVGWTLLGVVGPLLLWATIKELFDNAWAYFESVLRLELSRSMETRIVLRAASTDIAVLQGGSGKQGYTRATVAAISEVSAFFFTVESSLNGNLTRLVASVCLWHYPRAVLIGGLGVLGVSIFTRALWTEVAEAVFQTHYYRPHPTGAAWQELVVEHGTNVLYEGHSLESPPPRPPPFGIPMKHYPGARYPSYWQGLSDSACVRPLFGLATLLGSANASHVCLHAVASSMSPKEWTSLVVANQQPRSARVWSEEGSRLARQCLEVPSRTQSNRWLILKVAIPALNDLRKYCRRLRGEDTPPPQLRGIPTRVVALPETPYADPASDLFSVLHALGVERQHTMLTTSVDAAVSITEDRSESWWHLLTSRARAQVDLLASQLPFVLAASAVGAAVSPSGPAASAVDTASLILQNFDLIDHNSVRLDQRPQAHMTSAVDVKPLPFLMSHRLRQRGILASALEARVALNPQTPGVVHYDSSSSKSWDAMASLLEDGERCTATSNHVLDWYGLRPHPSSPVDIRPELLESAGWTVEFRGVWFSYRGPLGPFVLRDVSFVLPSGGFCGLVGPSGAGKSTILALILMMYVPTRGEVLLNGVPTTSLMTVRAARRRIGYFGGMSPLVEQTTIAENITLGDTLAIKQENGAAAVHAALTQSEGLGAVSSCPAGIATLVGCGMSGFSGGEEQRILLARAFVKSSTSLLLFDEPTSALDPATERRVISNLRNHKQSTTALIATHKLSALIGADWIVVLRETDSTTVVSEQGSWSALTQQPTSTLSRLLTLQPI